MRQIEEEYYKQEDTHANPQQKGSAATATTPLPSAKVSPQGADDLYTPSPEKPIEMINKTVPTAVQDAVNAIIKSNTRDNLTRIHIGDAKETDDKKEEGILPV